MPLFSKNPAGTSDRSSALLPLKKLVKRHAVVGRARFLAQHGDGVVVAGGREFLQQALPHHAIADDQQLALCHGLLLLRCAPATTAPQVVRQRRFTLVSPTSATSARPPKMKNPLEYWPVNCFAKPRLEAR